MSKLFNELSGTKFDKIEVAGQKYKDSKKYCSCQDSHLSVPGGIETAKCVYCKKPPYGVAKPFNLIMEADNLIFNSITK